jgi:hypothetical protein
MGMFNCWKAAAASQSPSSTPIPSARRHSGEWYAANDRIVNNPRFPAPAGMKRPSPQCTHLDRTLVRIYDRPVGGFNDGIDEAAAKMASRAVDNPDVAPEAIGEFLTAYGWKHADGLWRHPLAGTREWRVDALAWCLAEQRRRSGRWAGFCEAAWRSP